MHAPVLYLQSADSFGTCSSPRKYSFHNSAGPGALCGWNDFEIGQEILAGFTFKIEK